MDTTTKSIKGTRTEKNLLTAYIAESTAYTRYMFYANQAKKEKYYPIQFLFTTTANNEMHHGKIFFKYLEGGKVEVPITADSGEIGTTAENLATAAEEEKYEGVELYRNAAAVAREEGFDDIAEHFEAISTIEEMHRRRFLEYLKHVKEGTLWKREKPVKWQCLVCGYVFEGTEPPEACPACNHPREFYVVMDEETAAVVD